MAQILAILAVVVSVGVALGERDGVAERLPEMVAAADVVAFVRCGSEAAEDRVLPIVDTHGSRVLDHDGRLIQPDDKGYLHLGEVRLRFTPCTVFAALKGDPPKEITVAAYPPRLPALAPSLPDRLEPGKAALVFLQRADERGYLETDRMRPGAAYREVQVPVGTYGVLDVNVFSTVTVLREPDGVPRAPHPLQRVVLALTQQAGTEDTRSRVAALRLLATVASSDCLQNGDGSLLGEGYEAFFETDVAPTMWRLANTGPDDAALLAYCVLLNHGKASAAEPYVERLLAYAEHPDAPAHTFVGGLSRLGDLPNREGLCSQLLGSSSRLLVEEGLHVLRWVGTGLSRPRIRELLFSGDPYVMKAAMATLAYIDKDMDHMPEPESGEPDFSDGTRNAELLRYWRDKD